ncbi:hypothetical protein EDD86DRAFT_186668, partial [Gorgonomyces haynaldii]
RNNYNHGVVEKSVNATLTKNAMPYVGPKDPIVIDVPDEHLKQENPHRANITSSMQQRLHELEGIAAEYTKNRAKSTYDQMKELLDNKNFYETDTHFYLLDMGLVFEMDKKKTHSHDHAQFRLEAFKKSMCEKPEQIEKMTSNQPTLQSQLLGLLLHPQESVNGSSITITVV